jgi:lactobin A/cerein 7B family class IIb bacteriocin
MKNLNVKELGLQELSKSEVKEINGGFAPWLIILIFVLVGVIFATDSNDNTAVYINGEWVEY